MRKLDAVSSDNAWLCVERLASFVASVSETTCFVERLASFTASMFETACFLGLLCERNCNHEVRDDVLSLGRIFRLR